MRRKFVKIYAVVFLSAVTVLALLNLCNTGENYGAVIYYEKTKDGYDLKGVEIYAKPARASGYHSVELVAKSPPLVDFDPSIVKIERIYSSSGVHSVTHEVHVYSGKILLEPNTETREYISLEGCLTAKEPIKFRVLLSPVEGGWVTNVDNVSVIVSST